MDEPGAKSIVTASQESHVVLERVLARRAQSCFPIHRWPRVVCRSWHDHVVIGTTDVGLSIQREPANGRRDRFILIMRPNALPRPRRAKTSSAFRPGCAVSQVDAAYRGLSRDHHPHLEFTLLHAGGKWTTFRKMAENAVDQARIIAVGQTSAPPRICESRLDKAGYRLAFLSVYGRRTGGSRARTGPPWQKNSSRLPYIKAGSSGRRARNGGPLKTCFHDNARAAGARASIEAAPGVADLLAQELGRDEA
jgi:glycerol-3-phosphate dehydrogenase